MIQKSVPTSSPVAKRCLISHVLPPALVLLLGTSAAPSRYEVVPSLSQEEAVAWTQTWGTALSGSSLVKVAPAGWNAGAVSTKSIVSGEGHLEFTAGGPGTLVCGLTSRGGQGHEEMDYAIGLGADNELALLEGGVVVSAGGTFVAGDRLRVAIEGGRVRFYKNGSLLYSSKRAVRYPLSARAWLHDPTARIEDAILSGVLLENASWTDTRNVASSASDVWKNAGIDGLWDAGAVSTRAIGSLDGHVEFSAAAGPGVQALGLSHDGNGRGLAAIDYAIGLAGGRVEIFEAGVSRGSFGRYVATDRFRVALEGGVIRFSKNGLLLYTSKATPSRTCLAG